MREIKVLGLAFVLSVAVAIITIFIPIYLTGPRINFNPGRDAGGDILGPSVLLSCVVGGAIGCIVGVITVGYLAAISGVLGELKASFWSMLGYSAVIGVLFFLFYFAQTTNQYPKYSDLVKTEWPGLIASFIYGFIVALLPLLLTKRYFRL